MASGKRVLHLHIPVHIMRTVSTVVRSGGLASLVVDCKIFRYFLACCHDVAASQDTCRARVILDYVLTDSGFRLHLRQ